MGAWIVGKSGNRAWKTSERTSMIQGEERVLDTVQWHVKNIENLDMRRDQRSQTSSIICRLSSLSQLIAQKIYSHYSYCTTNPPSKFCHKKQHNWLNLTLQHKLITFLLLLCYAILLCEFFIKNFHHFFIFFSLHSRALCEK